MREVSIFRIKLREEVLELGSRFFPRRISEDDIKAGGGKPLGIGREEDFGEFDLVEKDAGLTDTLEDVFVGEGGEEVFVASEDLGVCNAVGDGMCLLVTSAPRLAGEQGVTEFFAKCEQVKDLLFVLGREGLTVLGFDGDDKGVAVFEAGVDEGREANAVWFVDQCAEREEVGGDVDGFDVDIDAVEHVQQDIPLPLALLFEVVLKDMVGEFMVGGFFEKLFADFFGEVDTQHLGDGGMTG